MASKNTAKVNPRVLKWARESAGIDISTAAKKIRKSEEDLQKWESGALAPTIAQARKAAAVYKRPFAALFLSQVPKSPPGLVDYRKISEDTPSELSPELRLLIRKARNKQKWVREWRIRSGFERLDFVASQSIKGDPETLSALIRRRLQMPDIPPKGFTKDRAFNFWYDSIEQLGCFVMRSNDIDPAEARGFSLSDEYAPFIFINNNDSKSAKIFTLIHELVHIWLGHSSLSNPLSSGEYRAGAARVEQYCNRVASGVLMPTHIVEDMIQDWRTGPDADDLDRIISKIAYRFKVSEESAARKLMDMRILTQYKYDSVRYESHQAWSEKRMRDALKRKGKPAPIKPSILAANRNGHSLIESVLVAVHDEYTDELTAAQILETRVNHLDSLEEAVSQAQKRRSDL